MTTNPNLTVAQNGSTGGTPDKSELDIKIGDNLKYDDGAFMLNGTIVNSSKTICDAMNNSAYDPTFFPFAIRFSNATVGIEDSIKLWVKMKYNNLLDKDKKDFLCVHVSSTTDSEGIPVILKETNVNSRVFASISTLRPTSQFKTNDYNFGPDIKSKIGDTLTAKFMSGQRNVIVVEGVWGAGSGRGSTIVYNPSLFSGASRINCSAYGGDSTDGDNVCNNWENSGGRLTISFNGKTYTGPPCGSGQWDAYCPATTRKDVFLEVDAMNGYAPNDAALSDIITAFRTGHAAGVYAAVYLHIQKDKYDITAEDITFPARYTEIKNANFASDNSAAWDQKAQVYHYALFGRQSADEPASSGVGELYGNDILVTLGNPAYFTPTDTMQQEATLIHELGHNLNLKHGGNDDNNCKPNYLSVMNYFLQFTDIISTRALDYSQSALGPIGGGTSLSETSLNEPNGLAASTPAGRSTAYHESHAGGGYLTTSTGVAVDWQDMDPNHADTSNAAASGDINNFAGTTPPITGCDGGGDPLNGYKDWSNNLKYDFRGTGNYQGASRMHDFKLELSGKDHLAMLNVGLVKIQFEIQHLDPSAFDPKTEDTCKTSLNSTLETITNSTSDNQLPDSIKKMNSLKKDVDNCVTDHDENTRIKNLIDDRLIAFKKASDYSYVRFDSFSYLVPGEGKIIVLDPDANTDDDTADTVLVHVSSTSDSTGIPLTLLETGPGTGVFVGDVTFRTTPSNANHKELQAYANDAVMAAYGVFDATAQIS